MFQQYVYEVYIHLCEGRACGLRGEVGSDLEVVHRLRMPPQLLHHLCQMVQGSGRRVQGSGFRVQGSGFRIQGSGLKVEGSGFRFQGSGLRESRAFPLQQALAPGNSAFHTGNTVAEETRAASPGKALGL